MPDTARSVFALILMMLLALAPLRSLAQTAQFNLPSQALAESLKAVGSQSNINVMVSPSLVDGRQAPALKAQLSTKQALERLLEGTGLEYYFVNDQTVVIRMKTPTPEAGKLPPTSEATDSRKSLLTAANRAGQVQDQADSGPQAASDATLEKKKGEGLSEIVVTGTHIAGSAPIGSSLTVYTRDDIDRSGAATVDQFARLMPGNFSNSDAIANQVSNLTLAVTSDSTINNISGGGSFNLHGLGASSTLTLLNGHRLAPAGLDGSLTDVSQIPLSAVDHIEVLADGASAIYGADAIAGVVNIITKKDFDGAETGLRYGGATAGGAEEVTASQLVGRSWGGGDFLFDYEYDDQGGLDASQREYIGNQGGRYSLVPENRRNSVFLSGEQIVGDLTTLSGEAIYSTRNSSYGSTLIGDGENGSNSYSADEKQSAITLTVNQRLGGDWRLSASGNYSRLEQTWQELGLFTVDDSTSSSSQNVESNAELVSFDVLANGALFPIAGGVAKSAIGASIRNERFAEDYVLASPPSSPTNASVPSARRNVASVYAEISSPIIGDSNSVPGAQHLDLSGAVRYDHYSDVGSTTNGKLGISWEPVTGLNIRGTFGTSFRAPLLGQLHGPTFSYTLPFPDASSPSGATDALYQYGGNIALRPERSRSFTTGFDLKPTAVPNFQLSGTYFHIDFDERLGTPPVVGSDLFTNLLAPYIVRNPSLATVQTIFQSPGFTSDYAGLGPAGVTALFNGQLTNIASTKESGVDLRASYRLPTRVGDFATSIDLERLIENNFQAITGSPSASLLNAFGEPTKWKGRTSLTWVQGPFSAAAFLNYVNGYQNTLFTPAQPIASWVTGDFNVTYKSGDTLQRAYLRKLTVGLGVTNITDKKPPTVQIPSSDLLPGGNPIPFDAANASPIGRFVLLQLTKGW